MGAQVALPDELVIDIAGDGSFEMTLQELSTVQIDNLPVKAIIINNGYLGMVCQWQELFWEGRYAGTSYEAFQPQVVLRREHLMLADVGADDRLAAGDPVEGLHDPLGPSNPLNFDSRGKQ